MSNTLKFGNGNWATKEGSTLAYNDENGNFKPLPFNFTRDTTATRVNEQGLIENVPIGVPRIDFSDGKGSLLLEPQRTNLYTYSNTSSQWTKSNCVSTDNYAISPNGNKDAFRVLFSSRDGLLYVTSTGVVGQNNTLSVWAKSNTSTNQKFRFFGDGNVIVSNDFVATNEWQRFEFTYNCSFVTAGLKGASDTDVSDILFYGFQHEEGNYATSYIPTNGATATRNAETCKQENLPSASIPNNYPFTVFCNFEIVEDVKGFGFSFLNIASSSEYFSLGYREDGVNNKFRLTNRISSISIYSAETSNTYGSGFYKVAVVFSQTNIKAYINGSEVIDYDHSSASSFSNINDLLLGQLRTVSDTGSRNNVKDFRLYNTALTDQELISLTS